MPTTITSAIVLTPSIAGQLQSSFANGAIALTPVINGTINASGMTGAIALTPLISGVMNASAMVGNLPLSIINAEPAPWPETGEVSAWELFAEQFIYAPGLEITLPALGFHATGQDDPFGVLSLTLPALHIAWEGVDAPLGILNLSLPALRFRAAGAVGAVGTMAASLPALKIAFTTSQGAVGSLLLTLPALRWSASGNLSAEGILAVSIPMLQFTGVITPSGDTAPTLFGTMVLNIKNYALTEYANYNFNSFCRFKGINLGAAAGAIYNLDSGADDAGVDIEWSFRTGYLDLHQRIKKALKQVWFSYKSDGDLMMTVHQPNGESYEYLLQGVEITDGGLRAKVGKGITSKYVALEVRNIDGSTISLDMMKLLFDLTRKER